MPIDVVKPLDLSLAELDAWRVIQATTPQLGSPYLAPEWMLALARSGGPDARSGRVAVVREGGEAVGFFPARVGPFTALPPGPRCATIRPWSHGRGLASIRASWRGRWAWRGST